MSELVYAIKWEIVLFAKLFQPTVGRLRIHRQTIPLCEQTVVLNPLTAESLFLLFLFCSELLKDFKHFGRQLNETHRVLGFCSVRVNAPRLEVR